MPKESLFDRLEQALQTMLARPTGRPHADRDDDPDVAPLVRLADELRSLPRATFRARLKADLERMAAMTTVSETVSAVRQTATPHLRVRNAPAAIEFYKNAFGARELMRFTGRGQIAHAELAIGNSIVMLGEEAPDYGYPSPEALGGSPVGMHLYVDDADALVARAVSAGARLVSPVTDQFYGDRSGQVADPFGYGWTIATRKEDMSVEEMHARFEAIEAEQQAARTASSGVPKGFHTVTAYVVVPDAPALIDFVKETFGGEETHRAAGPAGGIHAEVRIGDSMLMIGGGRPEHPVKVQPWVSAFHVYVGDTDATFERALRAGATAIQGPTDMEYGERSAGVKDAFGNYWYIATSKGDHYVPEGLQTLNVYLHPVRAEPLIAFLKRAFGAADVEKYASPDGVVHHARVRIGDTVVEMGEAHGSYQPIPTRFYLYVPNMDAMYRRALEAGAKSISEPADQPFGDRLAGVADAFGNQWYIATQIRETR
jgi:PhnB protein